MHQPKKKPEPARASGSRSNNSTPDNFTSLASIRRRFGTGLSGYEAAKNAWVREHQSTDTSEYTAAMRKIARAVRV